jgi:hypothetical protein
MSFTHPCILFISKPLNLMTQDPKLKTLNSKLPLSLPLIKNNGVI